MANPSFEITEMTRHDEGFWTAVVTVQDTAVAVDKRTGSWTVPADPADDPARNDIARRELRPDVCAALQAHLHALQDTGETAGSAKVRRGR